MRRSHRAAGLCSRERESAAPAASSRADIEGVDIGGVDIGGVDIGGVDNADVERVDNEWCQGPCFCSDGIDGRTDRTDA